MAIIHFKDDRGVDAHITACSISAIERLPSCTGYDGVVIPARTKVTHGVGPTSGILIVEDGLDAFSDSVAAWRAAYYHGTDAAASRKDS